MARGLEHLLAPERRSLHDTLTRMLDGRLDLIDGCRSVAALAAGSEVEHLALFAAFDSELDRVPPPATTASS